MRVLKALLVFGAWACGPVDRHFISDDEENDASVIDATSMPDGGSGGTSDTAIDNRRDATIDAQGDASFDNTPADTAQGDRTQGDTPLRDTQPDATLDVVSDTVGDVTADLVWDALSDAPCTVGGYRCNGTNLEYCSGTDWVVRASCATAALCDAVGGACTPPTCLPGKYQCTGASLEICNSDQNGWIEKEKCASAGLCDSARGICSTSACTPGAYQCSGATLQQCRVDQTGWDTVTVCTLAALCNATTGMCDTPPDTTIDTYPPNPSNAVSPSFTFSSTKMGSTFQCRIDGAAFVACTSPTVVAVAPGAHSFQVYAVDAGGVVDPSPANYMWSVDTTPPTVSIVTHPVNPTKLVDASFSFSSSEAGTTECRIDGGSWGICSSLTTMQYLGLAANFTHTFDVRVTDAAQNPGSASFTWTIDTTPPTTTITGGPAGTLYIRDANVAFIANETATFECSLDGAAWAACTSPRAITGLLVGSHSLAVRATDPAGNVESPPASRAWGVAYPLTCTRATVGANSAAGVISGATWKVCRSDWTTWASANTGGGNYNAVTACRSIGYRTAAAWGGNFNQVCVNESFSGGGGTDPTALSITVHWLCDDCGAPPAVNTTGGVGVSGTGVGGVPAAAWRVCRADWDTAWVSAGTGGGTYNAVQACQYLGYRTADAWGGNGNQVCVSEAYGGGGGSDPTSLSLTVEWHCIF
ncbi:MAG TPA: hypothetical protein VK550_28205 [Polyangiaceae bacterium]|nr:hypothetical protein [Polyangiaceae bacterium]